MAFLEKFSAEERALLVALPYRAGLWISQADATGDPAADEKERKALEDIIGSQVKGMFPSAFVHEVVADLWDKKGAWNGMESHLANVVPECREAAKLISQRLARRDLDAYRATVMHIATEVAKAFREYGHNSLMERLTLNIKLWKSRIGCAMRNEDYDPIAIVNISPVEDKALAILARALSEGAESAADTPAMPKT